MPATRSSTTPQAGEVDVDLAERVIMDHRGWCGAPDGTACLDCRQTAIEAVATLRNGYIQTPSGISSFVDLRQVCDIWPSDIPVDDTLVQLVARGLPSPQCMGTAEEAAKAMVAGFHRYGLLSASRLWGNRRITPPRRRRRT